MTHDELRELCRVLAGSRIEVPAAAEFTVGVAEDGQCAGATFCWWTEHDGGEE